MGERQKGEGRLPRHCRRRVLQLLPCVVGDFSTSFFSFSSRRLHKKSRLAHGPARWTSTRYDHPGQLNETTIFWQQIVDWKMSNYPGRAWATLRLHGGAWSPGGSSLARFFSRPRTDKPFTISETGAGGVYEWTNSSDPKWSQNYQNEVCRPAAPDPPEEERILCRDETLALHCSGGGPRSPVCH